MPSKKRRSAKPEGNTTKERRPSLAAVVLAAGKGTRMRSETAKVLHRACGRPLGAWPIEAARRAGADPIVVVIGHEAQAVKEELTAALPDAPLGFAVQTEQRGTGHAVMCARERLDSSGASRALILCGDVPCITKTTLQKLIRASARADVALLTFEIEEPGRYGRIVRDGRGEVVEIVEAADATPAQRKIREVNSGIYCIDTDFLSGAIDDLETNNAQGELYLTDLVEIATSQGRKVKAVVVDRDEVEGVNDRADLARAVATLRGRINEDLMRRGVSFEDPERTYVDATVKIGADSHIGAGAHLEGGTRIGKRAVIGPYAVIRDCRVEFGALVKAHSVLESAVVGPDAQVGPFARLRPGTVIGRAAAVGNFVEAKNATLGPGVKAGHLSYLGNVLIGEKTNIGAGTITCNYDGKNKHRTTIGPGSFIGSNTALVAPVSIGRSGYVAAGSTLTKDVPDGALAVGRGRQRNIEGWAERAEQASTRKKAPGAEPKAGKRAPRGGKQAAKRKVGRS